MLDFIYRQIKYQYFNSIFQYFKYKLNIKNYLQIPNLILPDENKPQKQRKKAQGTTVLSII